MIYAHKDKLYRLCLYLERSTDKADELFQDTWLRALEKVDRYDLDKPFYPWLTQVAVNLYRDKLRRFKLEIKRCTFEANDFIYQTSDDDIGIEEAFIKKEELKIVLESIQELGDKYRLPLLLVLGEQMSYKDVAQVLKIDEKLVKSRIYDGRQKLKKLLKKEGLYD